MLLSNVWKEAAALVRVAGVGLEGIVSKFALRPITPATQTLSSMSRRQIRPRPPGHPTRRLVVSEQRSELYSLLHAPACPTCRQMWGSDGSFAPDRLRRPTRSRPDNTCVPVRAEPWNLGSTRSARCSIIPRELLPADKGSAYVAIRLPRLHYA